jgi:hypothetical protein
VHRARYETFAPFVGTTDIQQQRCAGIHFFALDSGQLSLDDEFLVVFADVNSRRD